MGCSFRPDWVAGFLRIRWQLCTGLGGRNHRNTQGIGQWRPEGMTDKEIAERLEVSGDTVKNQKRQPFSPLPDTTQVREIMADMAVKLGLTLTEERARALLRQPG